MNDLYADHDGVLRHKDTKALATHMPPKHVMTDAPKPFFLLRKFRVYPKGQVDVNFFG